MRLKLTASIALAISTLAPELRLSVPLGVGGRHFAVAPDGRRGFSHRS
jgi:hypothetical protein